MRAFYQDRGGAVTGRAEIRFRRAPKKKRRLDASTPKGGVEDKAGCSLLNWNISTEGHLRREIGQGEEKRRLVSKEEKGEVEREEVCVRIEKKLEIVAAQLMVFVRIKW